jgi:hypothetical protein
LIGKDVNLIVNEDSGPLLSFTKYLVKNVSFALPRPMAAFTFVIMHDNVFSVVINVIEVSCMTYSALLELWTGFKMDQ